MAPSTAYGEPIRTEREKDTPTIQELINKYDWDIDIAYAVAQAESELLPTAYNPEWHNGCQGSYGIMQIACIHEEEPNKLFDAEYNIRRAFELYEEQGWKPWGVCHDGKVQCGL